jgi:hypothetical protein
MKKDVFRAFGKYSVVAFRSTYHFAPKGQSADERLMLKRKKNLPKAEF